MKVIVFSPHGSFSPGHATTYMMLRYLSSLCAEVTQLHCNGAFSICERDLAVQGAGSQQHAGTLPQAANKGAVTPRTLEHCLRCSAEQRSFIDFAGGQSKRLTDFLSGEDLQRSRQWVLERDAEDLWSEEWFDLPIAELLEDSFQRFTGELQPRLKSQRHSGLIKQLALTSIRMAIAAGKCLNQLRPDWIWLAGGDEMLSKSFLASAALRRSGMPKMQIVTFQTSPDGQMLLASREGDVRPYRVQNVVESLVDIRSEIDSWPKEVLSEFDEFFKYLGIPVRQLSLPVAR